MRLSVESTTFDNKLNICQFIVKSRMWILEKSEPVI